MLITLYGTVSLTILHLCPEGDGESTGILCTGLIPAIKAGFTRYSTIPKI